ncbi:NACHT domain-containing protein [Candidatus Protochlamydia sp. W-9]|uniref:NACHT domain-containing protein n=1 Tax=Candidatus Protochlamydia sp. W-9 TaxID=1785087 RepID=UPI00096AB1B6|nr:ATP-binding protein [Candidatus Protochlamydia sp. W-9]
MEPSIPFTSSITTPLITFHLDGKVSSHSDKYKYRLHLLLKQTITAKVEVSKVKKEEWKEWEVTFQTHSTDWLLANISRLMLQQHPQLNLTKQKSVKQLNLEFEQVNSKEPVHIMVEIKGKTSRGENYILHLCPSKLKESRATLQDKKGKTKPIALDLGFLEAFSLEDLRHLFLADFEAFVRIKIKQKDGEKCLCLSALNSSSLSLSSLKHTKDLVKYLKQGNSQDPIIAILLKKMVDAFVNMLQPRSEAVEEMIEIFDKLQQNDQMRVFRSVTKHFVENPLTDQNILKILKKILVYFQKTIYQQQVDAEEDNVFLSSKILDEFDANDLVKLLVILTENLVPQAGSKNIPSIQNRLRALVALLETMIIQKVQGVNKDVYLSAYKAINEIAKSKDLKNNLEMDYLAHYGKNSFLQISDDTTVGDTAKSTLSRTFYLLRGFAKIADSVSIFEPWHIVSLFDSVEDFKKVLSYRDYRFKKWFSKKQWFTSLLALRFTLFKKPEKFFSELDKLNTQEVSFSKKAIRVFHHPLFLIGFVNLLKEVLHIPTHVPKDLALKKVIIQLLQRIYQDNVSKEKPNSPISFKLESDEHRNQILEIVRNCLLACKTHDDPAVSRVTEESLKELNLQDVVFSPVSRPQNELFDQAVKQIPILDALKQISKQLEKDDQLKKESVYYISPNVQEDEGFSADSFPLKKALKNFFETENTPVLYLEGDGGAGKTLTMKVLTNELLRNYSSTSYFPFYTYLGSLNNPLEKIIEETFALRGMTPDQLNELKERKVVFICDAVDEINPLKLPSETKNMNMYEANNFAEKDIAKVIFVSKKGLNDAKRFEPVGKTIQKLILTPFNEQQIFDYLEKFAQERQKEENNLFPTWTAEKYRETFKKLQDSELWKLITNPFRLHVIVEVLPLIVESRSDIKIEEIFRQQTKGEIEQHFFDIFACVQAYRSSLKEKLLPIGPEKFLMYSAQLAAAMQTHEIFSIPLQAIAEQQEDVKDLSNSSTSTKEDIALQGIIQKFFKKSHEKFYKECLILKNQGEWAFMHGDYQLYFSQFGNYFGRAKRFDEIYNKYNLTKWIRRDNDRS